MQTKSNIQLIREAIERKEAFKTSISNIMEKYNIEDSVFTWKNGLLECTNGYFEVISEHSSLDEAVKEATSIFTLTSGIRVINNTDFQVGIIRNKISECDDNTKVFDIKRLENVR